MMARLRRRSALMPVSEDTGKDDEPLVGMLDARDERSRILP